MLADAAAMLPEPPSSRRGPARASKPLPGNTPRTKLNTARGGEALRIANVRVCSTNSVDGVAIALTRGGLCAGGAESEALRPAAPASEAAASSAPAATFATTAGGARFRVARFKVARLRVGESKEGWVQCEHAACGKWRRIPVAHMATLADGASWYCVNNPYKTYARCEQPQELSNDEIDRRMKQPAAVATATAAAPAAAAAAAAAAMASALASQPSKTNIRFWQACAACKRMRNVPKHVHDEVSQPQPPRPSPR